MEKKVETPRGNFTIRPYRSEDKKKVQELWEICFKKKIEKELWDWKYEKSPYGAKLLLCCSDHDAVAVLYGGIPYLANWNGKTIKIAHLMDIMAHPEYRGWLFIKTAKAFFDTCTGFPEPDFLYGLPGGKHYRIGHKLLKYRKLAGGMVHLTARTSELAMQRPSIWNRVFPVTSADKRFDRLWLKLKSGYPFSIIRDSRYVNWRFFNHPQHVYEVWGYGSVFSSEMKGYVVLLRDSENESVYLVDILMDQLPGRFHDLFCRIGSVLMKDGISEIKAWLPAHHFLCESAQASGFTITEEPLGIIPVGRSFEDSLTLDWISKNIFYTMSDGDLF